MLCTYIEPALPVLDDLFLARRISEAGAELLQTIVHQRYKQRRSLVVTSNRVVQDWGKYHGDATMGPPSSTASCIAPRCSSSRARAIDSRRPSHASHKPPSLHNPTRPAWSSLVDYRWSSLAWPPGHEKDDDPMKEKHGTDAMPETAENVATEFKIERQAQDRLALASQLKAVAAQKAGFFESEITPVNIPQKKGEAIVRRSLPSAAKGGIGGAKLKPTVFEFSDDRDDDLVAVMMPFDKAYNDVYMEHRFGSDTGVDHHSDEESVAYPAQSFCPILRYSTPN